MAVLLFFLPKIAHHKKRDAVYNNTRTEHKSKSSSDSNQKCASFDDIDNQ